MCDVWYFCCGCVGCEVCVMCVGNVENVEWWCVCWVCVVNVVWWWLIWFVCDVENGVREGKWLFEMVWWCGWCVCGGCVVEGWWYVFLLKCVLIVFKFVVEWCGEGIDGGGGDLGVEGGVVGSVWLCGDVEWR